VSFVDVARKPPSTGELRRFADRFGAVALLDPTSRQYRDAGLAYLSMDERGAFERVATDPRLLRLPLVRAGERLTIGVDEAAWRGWLSPA
jgi:arsenate reductase-like glutaredoxin family protein